MTRIGLISDTHGWLDEAVFRYFEACDEIWHAGDFGTAEVAAQLKAFKPLRGVWGNIDAGTLRTDFPETARFEVDGVAVMMHHIGGYPGRYAPGVKKMLETERPQIFVAGHSHILKVQYDQSLACLHLNPGAAGRQGWHTVRTLLRVSIDGDRIFDLEVVELGKRGQ